MEILIKYSYHDKLKDDVMDRACKTHTHTHTQTKFWWENLKELDRLEDMGIDSRIILKRTKLNTMLGCWMESSG
jgi:hypothetical protein